MNIRNCNNPRVGGTMSRRSPEAETKSPAADGFHLSCVGDFFSGAVPVFGLFAHAENQESLVSYPRGDAVFLQKGRANVETSQAGFGANLVGTVALAGAGLLSGVGLAAAAMPVAVLGVAALVVSGVNNAFTREEIRSA